MGTIRDQTVAEVVARTVDPSATRTQPPLAVQPATAPTQASLSCSPSDVPLSVRRPPEHRRDGMVPPGGPFYASIDQILFEWIERLRPPFMRIPRRQHQ